ncbi:hypothetical protein [Lentilactobacillus parakefiri]|nr:hypothetical protein [Lentilactobacillus parakefiri]
MILLKTKHVTIEAKRTTAKEAVKGLIGWLGLGLIFWGINKWQ